MPFEPKRNSTGKPTLIFVTKYSFPWMGVPFLYNIPPQLITKYKIIILSGDKETKNWGEILIIGLGFHRNIPIIKELFFSMKICKYLFNNFKSIEHIYVYNDNFVAIICGLMTMLLNIHRTKNSHLSFHIESKWFSKISELISPILIYFLNNVYDNVFVFDEFLEEYLIKKYKLNNKTHIVFTGVSKDYFRYDPTEQNEPTLVYAGTLHARRKLEVMLRAFKSVTITIPSAKLYIIGDGPDKNRLMTITKNLRLEKNIIFTGLIEHSKVGQYVNISTICIASYPKKGYDIQFPFKIFEYMACRKPVITTKTKSTSKYLINGRDAILINFKEEDIADSILNLCSNKELRDSLAMNGEKLIEKFKWEDVSQKIIQNIEAI